IAEGRYVELEGSTVSGYFPISIPLQGYVHEDFLTSCYTAQPPENCLQVASTQGITIYQQPTQQSETVGMVQNGRNVRVEEIAEENWVQVLAPLTGYASKAKLTTCPPSRFQ
ncbi:MAG TPA: SH3 domain-containing protein, partial [Xenococcaceae cyanobacterium]